MWKFSFTLVVKCRYMKIVILNPHDQSVVGSLPVSTKSEVAGAVKKARAAFVSWKSTTIDERIAYILKYRQLLKTHANKIAQLITQEMGKPISQSLDDVNGELEFLDYYTQKGEQFLSDEAIHQSADTKFRLVHEPYGVCACIAPWNFPVSMANSGIIPALIAGNCVVFKPSEYTSLSQKMLVDLLNQAGLPKGVLNVVIGDGKVGKVLLEQSIDLVWFTGSTAVGQSIYRQCGEKFVKSMLEMGGSSPAIVFADANLEDTVENLYWARFLNCGQVCTAIKRLFVEKKIYHQLVNMLVTKVKQMPVGNPMDKNTQVGPLVSRKQLKLLKAQVADAIKRGAKIELGGAAPNDPKLKLGNYYLPTILTNVKPQMRVLTEEVFGPVLPIVQFSSKAEVIRLANQTEYGLSAEIYTRDINKAEKVAKELDAGTVAINTDNFFKPECPFGGFKKSGMGKEYGRIGMQEFAKTKLIAVRSGN